jgi:hypothetical protein
MAATMNKEESPMRKLILIVALAILPLFQVGCAAGIHAGGRNGGVGAGAAVGQPVYVDPMAPIPR